MPISLSNHKYLSVILNISSIITLLLITAIHQNIVAGVLVILCVWALVGPKQAIQALSLNYIILLLNPSVYVLPEILGVFRWLILLIVGFRVLPFVSVRFLRFFIPLLLFFLIVTVLSWAESPVFFISFLKISVFTFCAATVLAAFDSFDEVRLKELKTWFLCLSAAVILLSIPTLFIPKIGYFRNSRGFQGIFNHPQVFGAFFAPIASFFAADMLISKNKRAVWLSVASIILCILIFLSQARTAMGAIFLSIAFAFTLAFSYKRTGASGLVPARFFPKVAAIASALVILIAVSPDINERVEKFFKKGQETSIEESLYRSRGGGMAFHWKRFLQKPLTGNGFGVDVAHGIVKNPPLFLGIPISASTEKGFLPAAFLEEVGIFGLVVFIPFVWALVKGAYSTRDVGLMSLFFGCIFVNIGEAVFFSPGQLGGYLWLLIGLSTAAGWQPKHEI